MFFEHLDSFINYDEIDKQQQIEINKKMSRAISKARSSCKLPYCYNCNKSTSQFCNSHYVPKFCLENIGINGEVTGPNSILKFPNTGTALLKEHIGINSSGTFQIICRDCDSKIFQEYENPKNYVIDTQLSQRILAQIAMKDYLKFISKRLFERSMYGELLNDCLSNNILNPYFIRRYDYGIKVSDIDLKIYNDGYKKAHKIANTNNTGYYIVYYKLLNYVAPIAVQTPITMIIDLDGNIVNDVFNMDANYKTSCIHICIFPLQKQTAILLFIEDGDKKYRSFYKHFRRLSEEEQLEVINYIVFLYCEDYFLARNINEMIDLNVFRDIAVKTPSVWHSEPTVTTSKLSKEFALTNYNSIPNLLSKQYKLR